MELTLSIAAGIVLSFLSIWGLLTLYGKKREADLRVAAEIIALSRNDPNAIASPHVTKLVNKARMTLIKAGVDPAKLE